MTVAALLAEDKLTFGISKCSKNDIFNKAKGRMIAALRAGKPNRKSCLTVLKNTVPKDIAVINWDGSLENRETSIGLIFKSVALQLVGKVLKGSADPASLSEFNVSFEQPVDITGKN